MTELEPEQPLELKLNQETGRITWLELSRHFARGVVVTVAAELDLVEVASGLARDDKQAFEAWIASGRVARASDEDAKEWQARDPVFWAVVVSPWVLVQEIGSEN